MAEGQGSSMFQAVLELFRQVQIIEEEITEEMKSPLCKNCVKERPSVQECWLKERVALFLCFDCEMYVCVNCLPGHNSHEGVRMGRNESEEEERETSESERMEEQNLSERMKNKGKGLGKKTKKMHLEEEGKEEGEKSEGDRMEEEKEREQRESERVEEESERKLCLLLDGLMRESETERVEKFERSHVSIYDRVYVKHELDLKDCSITGLCVLENQRWVACDRSNSCIKIFTLGSNVLQRYIRFVGSEPSDVTEILANQNSTEPNLASGSSSDVSATDWAEQKKQCLMAVMLPMKFQIMFIDLSTKPTLIHKIIHTEGICQSIQFNEDKIFTVCTTGHLAVSSCSVYIYSTNGDTLNKFNTGIYDYFPGPHLAVASGRVYLTDRHKYKVQCRNVEGQVLSEVTMKESVPVGISVDSDNNLYVCAHTKDKVYKLDADLTRYESVLDQTTGYIDKPDALCYYRDKLFISHAYISPLNNYVTVVRLL